VYLLRDYANILQRVGGYHLQQKEYEKSIEQYEIARDLYLNLMNTLPENGQAVRDLAWGDYFLGEAFIENGQHDDGLGRLEFGISLIRDRCVADTTDARTRNDIPRYVGAYVYKCGELEMHDRAKKTCYNVLLVLQPVIEGNPSNYALAEMYANLQKLHDEIGQVAAANQ
jgi:tetratricopeptide (TPR) repeat protein